MGRMKQLLTFVQPQRNEVVTTKSNLKKNNVFNVFFTPLSFHWQFSCREANFSCNAELLPLLPQNLGGIRLQDVDSVINKALMGCHGSFEDAWSQGEIKVTEGSVAAYPKAWLTKVKKELPFTLHVAKHRVIHYVFTLFVFGKEGFFFSKGQSIFFFSCWSHFSVSLKKKKKFHITVKRNCSLLPVVLSRRSASCFGLLKPGGFIFI